MSGQAVKVVDVSLATTPVGNAAADIRVQVSGAVMLPGAYPINHDDRVIDGIAVAESVAPNADLSGVNLSMRCRMKPATTFPYSGKSPRPSRQRRERRGNGMAG